MSKKLYAKKTIREIIDSTGWSLVEVANTFGIPYRTIQNWYEGQSDPPVYVIAMIDYILWYSDDYKDWLNHCYMNGAIK